MVFYLNLWKREKNGLENIIVHLDDPLALKQGHFNIDVCKGLTSFFKILLGQLGERVSSDPW